MDIPEQSYDPILSKFDKWLKDSKIESPENLLERVRTRLEDPSAQIDRKIDALFKLDASLSDVHMLWKVRGRLDAGREENRMAAKIAKYLVPLAAAATLTLALLSFQSQGTKPVEDTIAAPGMGALANVDLDDDMTRILALATNLEGTSNMSELESVEHLSFLFE